MSDLNSCLNSIKSEESTPGQCDSDGIKDKGKDIALSLYIILTDKGKARTKENCALGLPENLYCALGLPEDDSFDADAPKKAFRQLSEQCHPVSVC